MTIRYVITCEVSREEGKFASRDELTELIQSEGLDDADPGSVTTSEDATYNVDSWEVEPIEPRRAAASRRGRVR